MTEQTETSTRLSANEIAQRAAKVRVAVFDVDGVMTDGRIMLGSDGREYKAFNVRDGHGLVMLGKMGVERAVITGRVSQAVTTQGSGAKTIYISGQVGRAGESLATQADQAYASLRRQLEASGATPADLVKITVYMADYSQADAAVLGAAQQNGFPAENLPATTLIGVASLYSDTALIEIEGMAVVP